MNTKIIALLIVCSLAALSSVTEAQRQSLCRLGVDAGPCHSYVARWYYNTRTECCERFQYGGCNGNANRFPTKAACEAACRK